MQKEKIVKKKRLIKNLIVLSAFFISIVLISSSSMSVFIHTIPESKNINLKVNQEEKIINKPSTGLALKSAQQKQVFTKEPDDNSGLILKDSLNTNQLNNEIMWGYNVYASGISEGPVYFDTEDPGTITLLGPTSSGDFLSGGTFTTEWKWLACEYGSGSLWEIDPYDGNMTSIGGGGVSLNGLSFDPIFNRLYGASSSSLYEIDPDTGEQEYIGNFGNGPSDMIGIDFNTDGNLFGWDIGTDNLWSINKDTAVAVLIGSLGIDLNNAQDGAFDFETDTLYLTAFTTTGQLYTCDEDTGECTLIGDFQGGAQITASMFQYPSFTEHDVGIKNIISPNAGDAGEDMDVIINVKNYGLNTENNIQVNVIISKDVVIEEYNETLNLYINLLPGDEIEIDMPVWTPEDWQSVSNEYIDYKITALVTLSGDQNPNNDFREKGFKLYFGYFHDVGFINVNGPENGPAQTFPISGIIKNFGQYEECCFKNYVEISELDIENPVEIFSQDFSDSTFPPDGWTITHTNWMYSNTNNAGGEIGEARFYYLPASIDKFKLYTPNIDISNYDSIIIDFKQNVDHYTIPYTLQVETSKDGINWDVIWSITPISDISQQNISILTSQNVGSTTYVSWTFNGLSYNIDNWYVDDIIISGINSFDSEYSDYKCTNTINPSEEQTFEFNDWTPEFLSEETTGDKKYILKAWTDMEEPVDENPENDVISEIIELEFFHDVCIKEIISSNMYNATPQDWLHFDDGTNCNAIGLTCAGSFEYAIRLTPDELAPWEGYLITTVKRHHGYNTPFEMDGKIRIYGQGTSTSPGSLITEEPFSCYEADWHDIKLDSPVLIEGDKDIWVSVFVTHKAGEYPAGCDGGLDYPEKGDWISLEENYWSEISWYGFSLDWNIWAGISLGENFPEVYIQPGTQDIEGLATNFGTFPELDLVCGAEIYEYITDPENGTLVYEDDITDIDLDVPLGGTEALVFNDFTFAMEGIYGSYLDLPLEIDDYPENNLDELIIGVDDTYPDIWIENIDPPEPDGDNGWYISDVEITICAEDPDIALGIPGSGVYKICIRANGGSSQCYEVDCVTIIIDWDGDDLPIEFWAIDYVGNEGPHNTITLDMDQTKPDIDFIDWETYKENGSWYVRFTCVAEDALSGMNRIEMYIDDELHDIITWPGPFEFIVKWSKELKSSIFKFVAFDKAGNLAFDIINGSDIKSYSNIYIKQFSKNLVLQFLERFPILDRLLEFLELNN
jgi:hypothetical protein